MKRIIFAFVMIFSLASTPAIFAQMGNPVTFKVTNIPTKQGKIMLATAGGKYYGMADATTASTLEIKLDDIPYGEYTVYVFHDANNNYKLDKDADNVPVEYCATRKINITDRDRIFQIELVNIKDKKRMTE